MILSSPITITPPAITKTDGTVKTFDPITLTELDITIIDNNKTQQVWVQIRPFPLPIVLWAKEDYIAAGDYTQAQVETRVTQLLGNDPKTVLEKLFLPQPQQVITS